MKTFDRAFEFVRNLVRTGVLPTAVFGVADANTVLDLQAFSPHNLDCREDSIYHLFSVTKPFIGLALCQLWERGQLNLHEPVTKYIPDFGSRRTDTVSIWHLLTHTSGIDQTFGELLSAPPDDDSAPFTAHQVLVSAPMQTPAGAYKLYNNLAFTALQEIIEKVSGQTLYDYLEQNIFGPLHMADTSFSKLDEVPERVMHTQNAQIFNYARYLKAKAPSGGLFGSVPDLLKAGQCLLNNGTAHDAARDAAQSQRIIGAHTLRAMTTPQTLGIPVMRPAQEFVGTEVGLTFMLPVTSTTYINKNFYGHGGWGGCMFYVYPAEGLTFALGTNYLDIWSKFDLDRLHNVFAGCL